ncbi:MAG TPA: DUF1343 domain-containing protein [Candidatus Kryptonia bacterium]
MTLDQAKATRKQGGESRQVKFGSEHFFESGLELIKGKRIGFVTNHSAVLSDGRHEVDVLREEDEVVVAALFSPEHGIRGSAPAGAHVESELDPATGLQIYSLYGDHTKPEEWMLKNVDILIYDVQDAGTRFYTYISTMALAMEAAAEKGIPFVILDRPTIVTGNLIDGPFLHDDARSFIGMLPVPILYSMTPGELAGLIQQEYLKPKGLELDLTVSTLLNYKRSMWYDETGLPWVIPSPNVKTIEAATLYPGTALVEGTNLSEGRGTPYPFQYIGAPFIDGVKLAASLTELGLPGVEFDPVTFVPRFSSVVSHPRFSGELCHGIYLRVTDRTMVKPVEAGVALVCAMRKLNPAQLKFRSDGAFDRLSGDKNIKSMIEKGAGYLEIAATWKSRLGTFDEERKKYFLYP